MSAASGSIRSTRIWTAAEIPPPTSPPMSTLQRPPSSNHSEQTPTPAESGLFRERGLQQDKSPWAKRAILLLLLIGLLGGGVAGWPQIQETLFPEKKETEGLIIEAAKSGPFEIMVTERGTLDS